MRNRRSTKAVNIAKENAKSHRKRGKIENYYAFVFALRGPLREACLKLTSVEDFDQTAAQYAELWRKRLRPILQDAVLCRRKVMAHALLELVQKGMNDERKYPLALALALAMTDRAQQVVDLEDSKERRSFGSN